MKKAQDFIIDSQLGEKSYEVKPLAPTEENIVLSIEDAPVALSALKEANARTKAFKGMGMFVKLDQALRSFGSPKAKDMATCFRLLAIMLNAGVPLIKSLDTISEQTVNQGLKKALFEIARSIEKGGTLSGGLAQYPKIFSDDQLGMIRSGEASGQLNSILQQLATSVEKNASIQRKVKGAMTYPAVIMVILSIVVILMMTLVVPKIAEIFSDTKQKLPVITRVVIGTSNFLRYRWPVLIIAVALLAILFTAIRKSKQGHYATDWLLVHLPIVGGLIQKAILARFARALGNMLSSGVPIVKGLQINASGLGNDVYKRRVELATEDISRGIPLGESLRDSPEFPSMMVQMITVGEQTAQLDTIATKIAQYYEEEVDTAVASLSSVLEPIILVFVGVVVGGIIAAVMLPMIQLTQLSGAL